MIDNNAYYFPLLSNTMNSRPKTVHFRHPRPAQQLVCLMWPHYCSANWVYRRKVDHIQEIMANDTCSDNILRSLFVVEWVVLGLATILTTITLSVIIYHRHRFQRHHIFAFNIILADFIGAVCLDIHYLAISGRFRDVLETTDSVMYLLQSETSITVIFEYF